MGRCMDAWMGEYTERLVDRWILDGCVDGLKEGGMNGWMLDTK